MDTGRIIKKLRQEKGMTQQQLAELLGISKASVQKYEQGDVLNLKAEMLRKLCLYFDVPPFLFVFPEYLDAEKEILTEAYKWTEIFRTLTIYNDLSEPNKQKFIEFVNILQITEKYHNEKE